jgi:lipoyl(octanoyl) transferase
MITDIEYTDYVRVRYLHQQDYTLTWQAMKSFTDQRSAITPDEIWLVEHPPIFTQGQNGKAENILKVSNIPVIKSDRGGQITYHGPGQLVVYTLIDVKRKKWNIRQLVSCLEKTVIEWLAAHEISAEARCDAPGIYVAEKKICSLGLRIRRGCSYHGLALNLEMDLEPFSYINPCGFPALAMTQVAALTNAPSMAEAGKQLIEYLSRNLGYNSYLITPE